MKAAPLFTLLALLTALLFFAALLIGPAGAAPGESLHALIFGGEGPLPIVLREIRLPRALLALMVGASLGLSGAALQGYLRNPLAEPGLIGIAPSAALGAVLALQTGFAASFTLALPLAALAGAAVGVLLLLLLAGRSGGALPLILAGVLLSSFAAALTALALNLSPNPFAANEIIFWMMGSLADRSMVHVAMAAPLILLGAALLLPLGRGLAALTLGEEAAATLGVDLRRLRLMLVFGVAASVGAATAVAGAVGFVGLVIPHVLRPLLAGRPAPLLIASALGGAALVLAADIAVRLILPERDLKLGVLMALIGAPIFAHLLWRMRGEQ